MTDNNPRLEQPFWIVTVTDGADIHWSEVLWDAGYTPQSAIKAAWNEFPDLCLLPGHSLTAHGPYLPNYASAARLSQAA